MNYDRIILELIDRVSKLEEEVENLKKINTSEGETTDEQAEVYSSGRDKTKYFLAGKRYGKNRLVLAIVKKYMELNPDATETDLLATFDKSLQGSLGVVRDLNEARLNCKDYTVRYFTQPEEQIKTASRTMVVCNQWGVSNIGNIIARAKQLGIEVSTVE